MKSLLREGPACVRVEKVQYITDGLSPSSLFIYSWISRGRSRESQQVLQVQIAVHDTYSLNSRSSFNGSSMKPHWTGIHPPKIMRAFDSGCKLKTDRQVTQQWRTRNHHKKGYPARSTHPVLLCHLDQPSDSYG